MNDLQTFTSKAFGSVRVLYEDGRTLFCGKDVAAALGYSDATNAIKLHCHGVAKHHLIDSLGRQQAANFISEGDVYRLITHSRLPAAEKFERWVFDEVLPAVVKNGSYTQPWRMDRQTAQVVARIAALRDDVRAMTALRERVEAVLEGQRAELARARAEYGCWRDNLREADTLVERAQRRLDDEITRMEFAAFGPDLNAALAFSERENL